MAKVKKDWHRADIIAALNKIGTNVSALSRESGYAPSTLSNVFIRPWAKAELIVANRLGLTPSEIWPSRYFDRNGNQIERKRKTKSKPFSTAK
ncbi:helix-turn-helix domain-containing protein [Arsenophonus nasoniae]|uniref:Helix-turn-helix transcriptional regulator n=1 Tax=Arsenophonus nasoniae TaxID=638 RepID=A0AA95GBY0_9GAMM|nr:helix-turn-helix transcriptional regulator [Arsenophonus nasoniae]WGL95862.1 helix-turn-helix transcriptional regulator [Arsenophonus nasoniae]